MAKKPQLKTVLKNPQEFVAKNGFPELEIFVEKADLQKFYKKLDTATLEDWAELEGVEFKPNDHASIHRMRVAQAILFKRFPKEVKPKKESPYKQFTTEQLVEMAIQHEVPVEATDDARILRMRTIMALRAHKVVE